MRFATWGLPLCGPDSVHWNVDLCSQNTYSLQPSLSACPSLWQHGAGVHTVPLPNCSSLPSSPSECLSDSGALKAFANPSGHDFAEWRGQGLSNTRHGQGDRYMCSAAARTLGLLALIWYQLKEGNEAGFSLSSAHENCPTKQMLGS